MIICENCGNTFDGAYCNACGEKAVQGNDRSFGKLIHDAFHFITHFEGKLLTTLRTIWTRPGKYAYEFCNGIRKKYYKPLSFFLFLVILYLIFPLFQGLNMTLFFHKDHNWYGETASRISDAVMARKGMTFEELSQAYAIKSEKISKFLLFIILPAMALVSYCLGFRKRKYYYDHFIFSTEAISFFLMLGFLLFPLILKLYSVIFSPVEIRSESNIAISIGISLLIYLISASRRFFKFAWWYSILYSLLYIMALALFVEYIYKFILFSIAIRLV